MPGLEGNKDNRAQATVYECAMAKYNTPDEWHDIVLANTLLSFSILTGAGPVKVL